MRKTKSILAVILCTICVVSLALTACEKKSEETSEQSGQVESLLENTGIDMETAIPVAEKPDATEYKLVDNGASSYKIILPEQSTEMLDYAAKELQSFMAEATGVTLEIISDAKVESAEQVISLGKTHVATELGVEVTDEDDLGTSGYRIKTVGSSIAIVDDIEGDGEGVLYGVYDFMEDAIDFKVYAADEIVYTKGKDVPLYAYDEIVDPTFDERSLSYREMIKDVDYRHRMRLFDLYTTEKWSAYGHSQVSMILPYTGEHPEWYASGGTQLCWSAGEEMEQAFAENLIEIIKNRPNATYFMLGQEDTTNICGCDKCVKNTSDDKYGSYTGLQIVFLNNVIDIVEKWREQECPERELRYVCFSYQISFTPPLKKADDGSRVLYHEDCMPAEQLYILFAPIEADYSELLKDEEVSVNKRTYDALVGWTQLVGERLLVYEYDTNYRTYYSNFDNFEVVEEHYETYKEYGIDFMYSQGPVDAYIPCFTEMRIFVESQLMWDLENRNYNDLVNEFMAVYYKDAAPAMRKYYDYIREVYAALPDGGTGLIYAQLDTPSYYTFENMEQMDKYLDEALLAIEPLRKTDNELFSKLYYRIKKENVSTLWLKLNTFSLYYKEDEIENIALEFYYLTKHFGMEQYKEGVDTADMFYGFIREN